MATMVVVYGYSQTQNSPTVNWESAYRRERFSHSRPLTSAMALPMIRPPQNSVEDKHKPNQCEELGYNAVYGYILHKNHSGMMLAHCAYK